MTFQDTIKDSKKVLIISSQPLDLDSISSGIVMKKYLMSMTKDVKLLFPRVLTDEEKSRNSYLPLFNELDAGDTREELEHGGFDTLILLDGVNWIQFYDSKNTALPAPTLDKSKKIIQIDHHAGDPEDLASVKFKNAKASSTIEIILSEILPETFLDKDLSTLCYSGLIGDTGNFRWQTYPTTFKVAALLLDKGAETLEILDKMYIKTKDWFNMFKLVLENVEFDDELETVFLLLPSKKILDLGLTETNFKLFKESFISNVSFVTDGYPRGIVISEDSVTHKISISGRGNNLANKINLIDLFTTVGGNGGGHFNAAGMVSTEPFDQILVKLKDAIRSKL